ncbi:MAG: cytochrome P450 [Calditrichaeota bacterium]|nr:MAG: cytochrome P450 [Calditrichota bacterium]
MLSRRRRDTLGFLRQLYQQYGSLVCFKIGATRFYLANDPEYIREILVTRHKNFIKSRGLQLAKKVLGQGLLTSEGELHLRQRRMMQPAFHKQRIESYGQTMVDYAVDMSGRWQENQTVDMAQEMMRLTLSIAGMTLFSTDVASEADEIGQALTTAMKLFERITLPFAEYLDRLPLPSNYRLRKARARLDQTIYRMIDQRRRSGKDRGDILSMLLNAQDVEGDGGRMSDVQVRDEAMTLFLAGHETTAIALTWTWYLLSQHPQAMAKLQQELDEVLSGRPPTVEDIPRLSYTRNVFAESMRLYPPAYLIGRRATGDFELGGYRIPAGSIILMSQFIMHRNPDYFPEPEKFNPDRWTAEAEARRPRFAYFPFGGGPRVCIGEAFAWMEGVLVLATLAQTWQPELVPGHPVAMRPLITLRPKYGIKKKKKKRAPGKIPRMATERPLKQTP